MKILLQLVLHALGAVLATEDEEVTGGTLRQTLHGTSARVAPPTIDEALTVTASEGASHFQKLPGEVLTIFEKQDSVLTKFFPLQRACLNWLGTRILNFKFCYRRIWRH